MEYVKIHDTSITDKKFTSVSDYEEALINTDTRGFNIVYGNAIKGIIKYYQFQNRPDGSKAMDQPIQLECGKIYGMTNGSLD